MRETAPAAGAARSTVSRSASRTLSTWPACRRAPARGKWPRTWRARDATACGQTSRGRRHALGQNGDHAVCLLRSAADAKSLEHGPHAGRLFERLGSRHGGRHVPGRDRFPDRRFHHAPGHVLRRRRLQTVLRTREPGRDRAAGSELRSSGAHRPPHRRSGDLAQRDRRTRSGRPALGKRSSACPSTGFPTAPANRSASENGAARRIFRDPRQRIDPHGVRLVAWSTSVVRRRRRGSSLAADLCRSSRSTPRDL